MKYVLFAAIICLACPANIYAQKHAATDDTVKWTPYYIHKKKATITTRTSFKPTQRYSPSDSSLIRDLYGKNADDMNRAFINMGAVFSKGFYSLTLEDTTGNQKLYLVKPFDAFRAIDLWGIADESDFNVQKKIQKIFLYRISEFADLSKKYTVALRL